MVTFRYYIYIFSFFFFLDLRDDLSESVGLPVERLAQRAGVGVGLICERKKKEKNINELKK